MPKLEDASPFPDLPLPKTSEAAYGETRGQQLIKTELDYEQNVRFDVLHNYYGDGIVAIAPSIQKNWLCGYVTYPDGCPLYAEMGNDAVYDVFVHGGVTYERGNADGSYTYGFDCAHAGDGDTAFTNDPNWVLDETKRMHKDIMRLKKEWDDKNDNK